MSAPEEIVEPTIPDHIDRLKESFLLAAARGGRIVECQSLLELGADCDYAIDNNETPLLASVRNGHRAIVALLLAHGADPLRRDTNNNSVFHIIADTSGDEAMASLFSPHAATLAWDTNTFGKTAIDLAVERGDSTFAEHLHTLCETNNENSDSELNGQDSDSFQSSSSSFPHIASLQIDDDSNGSDTSTSCNDSNNASDNNSSDGDFSVSNNDDTSSMSQLRLQLYQATYALNEVMKDRDNLKVELDKFNPLFGKEDDSLAHYSLNELQALERQVKMALERIEKAKQNLEEEKLCVICRENPKVMLIMPCRHLCVCEECGHRVELDRCPLCRNVIAERFSVFS